MVSKTIDEAPDDLAYEIKRYDDWDWDEAASISWRESDWRWNAWNDTTTTGVPCGNVLRIENGVNILAERSGGYFQLNTCNYDWRPDGWWFNVQANVGEAHNLWKQRGWAPWYFSAQAEGLLGGA